MARLTNVEHLTDEYRLELYEKMFYKMCPAFLGAVTVEAYNGALKEIDKCLDGYNDTLQRLHPADVNALH